MAVEIKMTGICEDCPCADLELSPSAYYGNNKLVRNMWDIRCTKESACMRMLMMERNRISESLENGTTVVSTEGDQNE